MNIDFTDGIPQELHIIPQDLDLTGATGTFVLRDKSGIALYPESGEGVSIVTVSLVKDLRYPDGTVIEAGTEVQAILIAPDLSGLALADPDHVQPRQYRYGITINNGWSIKGYWTVWPDSGPARCNQSVIGVCCGPQQVAIAFGGIPGQPGIPGEGYSASYRKIISSAVILPTDSTVEIVAGGSDISVALPDPAALFSDSTTKQGRVYRGRNDTGLVTITGSGVDLFDGVLYPGESFTYESNGTVLIIGG